jgi:hypothetical protein
MWAPADSLEKALKISGAVDHVDDLHALVKYAIKDDIALSRKAAQVFAQLWARAARVRIPTNEGALRFQHPDEASRCAPVVARYVIADVAQVLPCFRSEAKLRSSG